VGKMTTALEVHAELQGRGVRSAFVATGQTGIFVADHGAAIDAVPADFAAGAVEKLVLDAARDADVVLVEGQGAIHHPAYSGVTLALMHGACPEAMKRYWPSTTSNITARVTVAPTSIAKMDSFCTSDAGIVYRPMSCLMKFMLALKRSIMAVRAAI